MTPYEFVTKWRASALKECSAAQEHFIDLGVSVSFKIAIQLGGDVRQGGARSQS